MCWSDFTLIYVVLIVQCAADTNRQLVQGADDDDDDDDDSGATGLH